METSHGDLLWEILAQNISPHFYDAETVTDEMWEAAIELTILLANPDLYLDRDALWGREIANHSTLLLLIIFMYASVVCAEQVEKDAVNKANAMVDKLGECQQTINLLQDDETLAARVMELELMLEAAEKENQKLKNKLGEKEKLFAKESAALNRRAAVAERELQQLKEQIKNIQTEPAPENGNQSLDEHEAAEEEQEDCAATPPDLPEKGILFIGGHTNMLKKLRQRHPGWKYTSTDDLSKDYKQYSSISHVFLWTEHMSHKMQERFKAQFSKDATICYVDATNIPMLERQMAECLGKQCGQQISPRKDK